MYNFTFKIGSSDRVIPEALCQYKDDIDALEIHLHDRVLSKGLAESTILLSQLQNKLKTLVFHMPFPKHTFDTICLDDAHIKELKDFIKELGIIRNNMGVENLYLLFHQENSIEGLIYGNCIEKVSYICNIAHLCDVKILFENCIPDLTNPYYNTIPAFDIVQKLQNPNVYICLDLCHARIYENIYKEPFKIPEELIPLVKWVHFSYTKGEDGFKNSQSHSAPHDTAMNLVEDVIAIHKLGVSEDACICLEITEEDYTVCEFTAKEMKTIQEIILV